MTTACPIFGDLSYLYVASETAFGVQDGSPVWNYLPVLSYSMERQPEMRRPMPFTGLAEEFDSFVARSHVAGQISAALYGWHLSPLAYSLAQYCFEWAFTDLETVCGLPSKTLQWAEGPDVENKTTLGATVNGATLSGSEEGSVISLSLDVMAATEAALVTAQAIPPTLARLNEFMFYDATFSIGPNSGALVAVPNMKHFQWQNQRSLAPIYNGKLEPQYMRPAKPNATFQFGIEKGDGTWDAIRRSNVGNFYYGQLVLKGLHNGTGASGTYAQVTIVFPRLAFQSVKDNYVRSGPLQQTISFQIQKPSTSVASFTPTWSLS